jgi:hypothetical protein
MRASVALLNAREESEMKLKAEADAAAAFLRRSERTVPEGEQLRDFLDGWTQGELVVIDAVHLRPEERVAVKQVPMRSPGR